MWMDDNGQAAKTESATIAVKGSMRSLQDSLFELDGLRRVVFDAASHTIRVDYDPSRMSRKQLEQLCRK